MKSNGKQKFTHFRTRDKPKKRRGVHTKSLNKHKKLQKKLTRYKGQGRLDESFYLTCLSALQ